MATARLPPDLLPAGERPPAESLAAAAEELGLTLDPEQVDKLVRYAALLQRWNGVYNLTAIRDPRRLLTHHLLDCLAIVPAFIAFLTDRAADQPAESIAIADVGTGAGLPAVPLAIARTDWRIVAVDAVEKKTAFVRHVRAELRLPNLDIEHARVETWHPSPGFSLVTSRAFASLADFVRWTRHLLAPGGAWAALKGAEPADEIRDLPDDVHVVCTVKLRVPLLDEQRHLIFVAPKAPPADVSS